MEWFAQLIGEISNIMYGWLLIVLLLSARTIGRVDVLMR